MSFLAQPAVQSYEDSVTGQDGWTAMASPGTAEIVGQTDSATVWTQFDFASGAQISRVTEVALGVQFTGNLGSMILDPSGNVWMFSGNGAPKTFNEISLAWAIEASWGAGGGAPPTDCPESASLVFLTIGSTHWLVNGAQILFGHGNITVMRADPPAYPAAGFGFWGHEYNTDNSATYACAGPQSSASATAYWTTQLFSFGKTVILAGADGYDPATWPATNTFIALTTLKTYAPTDFDAAWTHITTFTGPAWDSTDGNLILMVATTDSVTNKNYIVKVSKTDGSVIWKLAVPSGAGFDSAANTRARVQSGTFLYFAQTGTFAGTVYAIDTATGAADTMAYTGIFSLGKQVSDDVLGCVLGECAWDTADGSLTLLNSTAASGGPTLSAVYFVTPAAGGAGAFADTQFLGEGV